MIIKEEADPKIVVPNKWENYKEEHEYVLVLVSRNDWIILPCNAQNLYGSLRE